MEHKNVQLNALQLEKNELKQYLFTLQSELKGVPDNHLLWWLFVAWQMLLKNVFWQVIFLKKKKQLKDDFNIFLYIVIDMVITNIMDFNANYFKC